ncbi:spore coat associated protein CotJA [Heliophilum fasciatum]|uniref:Spore coat associated protein JA (CotJA) n=1 Tax=Heliophilum fasciatum TaxID=35700 RepID=A0A4R2RPE8_9FIRM|nr:spore coat associated protein CotJA [Heliophilum fasciatum]MCW2277626.1 hypothetical protein [Heliophilum fasciatum]TCP64974.1 spore coat associated protein JA (CotJA) [Heliophilum fasciatum]
MHSSYSPERCSPPKNPCACPPAQAAATCPAPRQPQCIPLAQARVAGQAYKPPFFSPMDALCKGTVFPELYQPYHRKNGKC